MKDISDIIINELEEMINEKAKKRHWGDGIVERYITMSPQHHRIVELKINIPLNFMAEHHLLVKLEKLHDGSVDIIITNQKQEDVDGDKKPYSYFMDCMFRCFP